VKLIILVVHREILWRIPKIFILSIDNQLAMGLTSGSRHNCRSLSVALTAYCVWILWRFSSKSRLLLITLGWTATRRLWWIWLCTDCSLPVLWNFYITMILDWFLLKLISYMWSHFSTVVPPSHFVMSTLCGRWRILKHSSPERKIPNIRQSDCCCIRLCTCP
jgi:hypothetical protein